jgi:hypothetical protein
MNLQSNSQDHTAHTGIDIGRCMTPRVRRLAFTYSGREWRVEADPEGNARYMVRCWSPTTPVIGRIRIGYLTGAGKTWVAERFGGSALQAKSAVDAMRQLAEWALTTRSGAFGQEVR